MGGAIARRLSPYASIFLFDRHPPKIQTMEKEGLGIACKDLGEALTRADIVLLAVKPQNFEEIAPYLNTVMKPKQLLISLLTGTTLATLKSLVHKPKIIRMMPNLALQCGEGVIGLSAEDSIDQKTRSQANDLFNPLGKIYWLPESKMDALTALTGSGPAFMFVIFEAIIEAGILLGFNSKDSSELVLQMIKGSVAVVEESTKHPGEHKWQVTSPSGTTIAGIKQLEKGALRHTIMDVFLAAYERAIQLQKQKGT